MTEVGILWFFLMCILVNLTFLRERLSHIFTSFSLVIRHFYRPVNELKSKLSDSHPWMKGDRNFVDVGHLEGNRSFKSWIDVSCSWVDHESKSPEWTSSFTSRNEVIWYFYPFEWYCKHKLSWVEDKSLSFFERYRFKVFCFDWFFWVYQCQIISFVVFKRISKSEIDTCRTDLWEDINPILGTENYISRLDARANLWIRKYHTIYVRS